MSTSQSQRLLAAVQDDTSSASVDTPAKKRWRPVIIVAGPRAGSGKTFLARLLIDFLGFDGDEVQAFDLNNDESTLAAYRPASTTRSHVGTTEDQIALFDCLIVDDRVAKVIDVGHESFVRLFAVIDEIGFIEEARRRSVEVVVLFAADTHPTSAQAYRILQQRLPDMLLVPVFNEAILKGAKVRERYPISRAASVPLQVTTLPAGLKAFADNSESSFAEFHDLLPIAIPIERAFELRAWTRRAFLEFRELELRILLEKLRASLTGVTGSGSAGSRPNSRIR